MDPIKLSLTELNDMFMRNDKNDFLQFENKKYDPSSLEKNYFPESTREFCFYYPKKHIIDGILMDEQSPSIGFLYYLMNIYKSHGFNFSKIVIASKSFSCANVSYACWQVVDYNIEKIYNDSLNCKPGFECCVYSVIPRFNRHVLQEHTYNLKHSESKRFGHDYIENMCTCDNPIVTNFNHEKCSTRIKNETTFALPDDAFYVSFALFPKTYQSNYGTSKKFFLQMFMDYPID